MDIPKRLDALRARMKEKNIDIYVIPTADFHQSEYVGEYFKARTYLSGFTGSAGTLVITKAWAGLWTDGRYFLQAAKELVGSTIELMKMNEPGVPTISDYIKTYLPMNGTLGFDGRVISLEDGREYEEIAKEKAGKIVAEYDLCDAIWTDRPALSKEPAFALDIQYAGKSAAEKLAELRSVMAESGATLQILTSLDDICWMLNIRGGDVAYSPLVLSYMVIGMECVDFYVDKEKFDILLRASLEKDGVIFHPYHQIYKDITQISEDETVMLAPDKVNVSLYRAIPEGVRRLEMANPQQLLKAIKNEVEIANVRKAALWDSVAHVRFMKWLKENYESSHITEISAGERLDAYRAEFSEFLKPSFEPICAFGEHAAMIHYSSTPETDVRLTGGTLFLTDTGGAYLEGSTDITRTYALGEIPQRMKEDFTLVAMGNLRLSNATFLKGCSGVNLDILARGPLWEHGKNYNHGTGHGVGYLLNIHEGPANIGWRVGKKCPQTLEPGMILTDEPGYYEDGSHGIRLENDLLVCEGEKTPYGHFLHFEVLTFVPFDLDAMNTELMTAEDKRYLNEYHTKVYEKVSPYLDAEEKLWLKKYTREI